MFSDPPNRRRRRRRRPHSDSPEASLYKTRRLLIWIAVLSVVAVLACFLVFKLGGRRSDPYEPVRVAEHFVTERMGNQVIPRFGPPEWAKVTRDGDGFTILGTVEGVPRRGGAATSYSYTCVLNRADGNWNLIGLELMKQ